MVADARDPGQRDCAGGSGAFTQSGAVRKLQGRPFSMISPDDAQTFAREWVKAWNDHDLEAILAHYAEDVVFHSPRIRIVTGRDVDALNGKAALRDYWGKALDLARDLYFEVDQVFASSDALTILYTNHRQQQVTETFVLRADGKVVRSVAAYA